MNLCCLSSSAGGIPSRQSPGHMGPRGRSLEQEGEVEFLSSFSKRSRVLIGRYMLTCVSNRQISITPCFSFVESKQSGDSGVCFKSMGSNWPPWV